MSLTEESVCGFASLRQSKTSLQKGFFKLTEIFPQDLAYILNRVGRILTQKNRKRMAAIFKLAADKIGKISMFSDFDEN
jgi:hypothetical protein